MPIVFISHAVVDKPLTDGLVDLLQTGCSLPADEIFCVSVEGAGIEVGEDFVRWIRDHLADSSLVILVVTPNYLASRFCVAEMGAAWALERDVFPIVLPDFERDIGGVLLGRQTAVLSGPSLDDLRDQVARYHTKAAAYTARWSVKKEEFLSSMPERLSKLPAPKLVERKEFEAEREKVEEAMEMNRELALEVQELKEHVEQLEQLKNKEEVDELRAERLSEPERYEVLRKRVTSHLTGLSGIEVRCLFERVRGEDWQPTRDTYAQYETELRTALDSEWIIESREAGNLLYTANPEHPRYTSVLEDIDELARFLEEGIDVEVKSRMEKDKGYVISIQNRQYWNEALYLRHLPD